MTLSNTSNIYLLINDIIYSIKVNMRKLLKFNFHFQFIFSAFNTSVADSLSIYVLCYEMIAIIKWTVKLLHNMNFFN